MATTAKNGAAAATTEAPDIRSIEIPQINFRQAILHVAGISPLICHRWSEKAARAIEDAQTGKAKQQKAARVPAEEFISAAYILPGKEAEPDWEPGKYFFPASAFKHAFLYGVAQIADTKRLPKTQATGWVFPDADPILEFERCELRTDITRNPVQPVYRPYFFDWGCDLHVSYNDRTITLEQVVSLFDLGGFSGGIGEWRPSAPKNKSGSFGRFRIDRVEGS